MTVTMLDFKLRVVEEKRELDVKCAKLKEFIEGTVCPTLPDAEQERLGRQLFFMGHYSSVLAERIHAFE